MIKRLRNNKAETYIDVAITVMIVAFVLIFSVNMVSLVALNQNMKTMADQIIDYAAQNGTTYPDRTEWHNIVLWGKLAEVAEKFIHKGSSVFVQGKMRTRCYEDKNGIKRYVAEIEGDIVQMLDRKADGNQSTVQQLSHEVQTPNNPSAYKKDNDDLPF